MQINPQSHDGQRGSCNLGATWQVLPLCCFSDCRWGGVRVLLPQIPCCAPILNAYHPPPPPSPNRDHPAPPHVSHRPHGAAWMGTGRGETEDFHGASHRVFTSFSGSNSAPLPTPNSPLGRHPRPQSPWADPAPMPSYPASS